MDTFKFNNIVELIIDNLEGGYFHPDMLKDGRIKDLRYSNSGETMFGIDRLNGGDINTSVAGKEFWSIIDNENARVNWKWNYRGGLLSKKLKELVAEMMYPRFEKYINFYLEPKTKRIVLNDEALTFNFAYAVWNGVGWFKTFATKLNNEVRNGITNKTKLFELAIKHRIETGNSLLIQGARKIQLIDFKKNNTILIIIITTLAIGVTTLFLLNKKRIINLYKQ